MGLALKGNTRTCRAQRGVRRELDTPPGRCRPLRAAARLGVHLRREKTIRRSRGRIRTDGDEVPSASLLCPSCTESMHR
jgi:hypothetical protein